LPKITEAQKAEAELEITLDDLHESLSSMQGGKSPGNDGFGKEFYMTYWDDKRTVFGMLTIRKRNRKIKQFANSKQNKIVN